MPTESKMDLAGAMKAMADWSQAVGLAAKAYAEKLPENSAQRATATMLLKHIADFLPIAEDMDRLAMRFFVTVKAIQDCGAALETERGEEFTEAVPGPPIQVTFGQVVIIQPTGSCSCSGCVDPSGAKDPTLN